MRARGLLLAGSLPIATMALEAAHGQALAIVDVTVIDGTGGPVRPHMSVVVRNGRIVAVDSAGRVNVPGDARVVHAGGRFLIPGLWDAHVHLSKAGERALELFLANGVTSVRDAGGDAAVVARWRSEIAGGARVGPRIRMAGPILEDAARVRGMQGRTIEPVARYRAPVADTVDAGRVVDSVARLGADIVKVRTAPSRETFLAIGRAARRAGLPLAAHGDIVPVEDMLAAGQRSIEHAIYPPLQRRDSATRARLVRELARAGVAIVPTLVNYYEWLIVPAGDARKLVEDTAGALDPRRRYVSGYLVEDWREQARERGHVRDVLLRWYMRRAFRGVLADHREMHRAGVRMLPGTDVGVALMYPGFSLHDELGYFVDRIGMTPMEALLSATRVSADFAGMADSLGTIAAGQLADLVLLTGDPLADVRNTRRIHAVVARGELLDRAALDRLLGAAAGRAR